MNFDAAMFLAASLLAVATAWGGYRFHSAITQKIVCQYFVIVGPLVILCLYITWSIGRILLGHWPRPSIDDPKDIPWLGLPYLVTLLVACSWPVAATAALAVSVSAWCRRQIDWKARLAETLIGAVFLTISMWFCQNDPNRVAEWFAD